MNGPITTEETYHISNIIKHYAHAREKHTYFCDRLIGELPKDKVTVRQELAWTRMQIKLDSINGSLSSEDILKCEILEAYEAMHNHNYDQAVEELYDCIAVCLRTIDVIQGRQILGKPETEEAKKKK